MQQLHLDPSSKAFLTATVLIADPNKPGSEIVKSFTCDLNGAALAPGAPALPVYRDLYTGTVYVRVAENIPSTPDSPSQDSAKTIQALKPIFYVSPAGDVKGWFIEATNFDATASGKEAA
jgi:hypothetical protein